MACYTRDDLTAGELGELLLPYAKRPGRRKEEVKG